MKDANYMDRLSFTHGTVIRPAIISAMLLKLALTTRNTTLNTVRDPPAGESFCRDNNEKCFVLCNIKGTNH